MDKWLVLWFIGFPLILYTVWYANAVYQDYTHDWIPTRSFPQRPDLGFYIVEYFFCMVFGLIAISLFVRNPFFIACLIIWISGSLIIFLRKRLVRRCYCG